MQDDCITVALGLPELRVLGQHQEGHQITVEVMYRTRGMRCPGCDQETLRVHSVQRQWKQDRRLWDKPVWLRLHKRRFRCGACGKVFTEPDPVFGHRRRSSQRFRSYLGQEAVHQPVRHVARKEGIGEALVRRCVTELAQRLLQVPAQSPPMRILGLDECSIKKGQVYDTALMDLEHQQVVGVVSGHRQTEVPQFVAGLSAPEQVVAVVMDMHEPLSPQATPALPAPGQGSGGQVPCPGPRPSGPGSGADEPTTPAGQERGAIPGPLASVEGRGAADSGGSRSGCTGFWRATPPWRGPGP